MYDGMLERLRCPVTAERVDSRRAPPERALIVQLLVHGGVESHRGTLVLNSLVSLHSELVAHWFQRICSSDLARIKILPSKSYPGTTPVNVGHDKFPPYVSLARFFLC